MLLNHCKCLIPTNLQILNAEILSARPSDGSLSLPINSKCVEEGQAEEDGLEQSRVLAGCKLRVVDGVVRIEHGLLDVAAGLHGQLGRILDDGGGQVHVRGGGEEEAEVSLGLEAVGHVGDVLLQDWHPGGVEVHVLVHEPESFVRAPLE